MSRLAGSVLARFRVLGATRGDDGQGDSERSGHSVASGDHRELATDSSCQKPGLLTV
jgi:hypothetical protein